jgi:hypothetical protein
MTALLVLIGTYALYRSVRWWRRNIAWEHSDDGGAAARRIRAQQFTVPGS